VESEGSQIRNNLINLFETQANHKIADIYFSFDNGDLIKLLINRGKAITFHDFDKVCKINQ